MNPGDDMFANTLPVTDPTATASDNMDATLARTQEAARQALAQGGQTLDQARQQGGDLLSNAAQQTGDLAGQTLDGAGQIAGQVRDGAGQIVGQVADQAGQIAGQVKDQAGQIAAQAGQQVNQLAMDLRAQLAQFLTTQKDGAARALDEVATAAQGISDQLRADNQQMLASAVDAIVANLRRFAAYLHEKTLDDLVHDFEQGARSQQALLIAGGIVLGLLSVRAARMTRQS